MRVLLLAISILTSLALQPAIGEETSQVSVEGAGSSVVQQKRMTTTDRLSNEWNDEVIRKTARILFHSKEAPPASSESGASEANR